MQKPKLFKSDSGRLEIGPASIFKVKKSYTPEYHIFYGMWKRCENPKTQYYPRYGGRGIKVCERWRDFNLFMEDMGPRPTKNHSLDRINNDGGYSPKNCRWATPIEQSNNSSINHILTFKGRSQSISLWAREIGINKAVLRKRVVLLGWSIEKALTAKIDVRCSHPKLKKVPNAKI